MKRKPNEPSRTTYIEDADEENEPWYMRLDAKYGDAGYGRVKKIRNTLRKEPTRTLPLSDLEMLAHRHRWDLAELNEFLSFCFSLGIFQKLPDGQFHDPSLTDRVRSYEETCVTNTERARAGGIAKQEKRLQREREEALLKQNGSSAQEHSEQCLSTTQEGASEVLEQCITRNSNSNTNYNSKDPDLKKTEWEFSWNENAQRTAEFEFDFHGVLAYVEWAKRRCQIWLTDGSTPRAREARFADLHLGSVLRWIPDCVDLKKQGFIPGKREPPPSVIPPPERPLTPRDHEIAERCKSGKMSEVFAEVRAERARAREPIRLEVLAR